MNRKEKTKVLGEVIDHLWNMYADDMFINDMGVRDTSMTFNRGTVAEVCLDLWWPNDKKDPEEKESVEWYLGLAYSTRKVVLRKALPIKTYGY